MKLNHSDTDSLYIDLSGHPRDENREVSKNIVLDYDAEDLEQDHIIAPFHEQGNALSLLDGL